MPLLIDGFNLIYKFPDLEELMYYSQLDRARDGLLAKMKEYQKIKKSTIRIVFDGTKGSSGTTTNERSGSIDIYYSLDYSADYLIKQFIKKDPNPKMTTVVTSDKDILFYVNRYGAKTMQSEKFADYVNKTIDDYNQELELKKISREKENPLITDDEISYWQKIFTRRKKNTE